MAQASDILLVAKPGSTLEHVYRDGRTVQVVVLEGGRVQHADRDYSSLNKVTSSLEGRPINVWDFWKLDGKTLSTLRAQAATGAQTNKEPQGKNRSQPQTSAEPLLSAEPFVGSVIETFKRERSRYTLLAETVNDHVERSLRTLASASPSFSYVLQSRVKNPEALRAKLLHRWGSREKSTVRTGLEEGLAALKQRSTDPVPVHLALDSVKDLVGVRILAYTAADSATALKALLKDFKSQEIPLEVTEVKVYDAKHKKDRFFPDDIEAITESNVIGPIQSGDYRALHVLVYYDEAGPSGSELGGARCEIQITTVLQHAQNEMSHRVKYKGAGHIVDRSQLKEVEALSAYFNGSVGTAQQHLDKLSERYAEYSRPDDAAVQTAASDLGSDRRAETVSEWITQLIRFAQKGWEGDLPQQLMSKAMLEEATIDFDAAVQRYTRAYENRSEENKGWDPRGTRELDEERSADSRLLRLLATLEPEFLLAFVNEPRRGRPSAISDIVKVWLEGAKQPSPVG